MSLGNGCLCCAVDATGLDQMRARPAGADIDVVVIEASGQWTKTRCCAYSATAYLTAFPRQCSGMRSTLPPPAQTLQLDT
ncbi:MAG TPA: GTP-binding protein [Amycolatopsis sp.]|nr:GTP-binding protein [Amycolatopsis sp.]